MTLKVGIIGSCVSRLAFRSDFVPQNKFFFEVTQYQFHTSLISLMEKYIPYNFKKFKGADDDYAKEHLMSELEKDGLINLVATGPDLLIIDFYPDIHFGVSYTENSIITNKCWRYKRIEAFKDIEIRGELDPLQNFDEYFQLWDASLEKFIEFINTYLPNAKIFVTNAKFADTYLKNGQDVLLDVPYDIEQRNVVWDQFNKHAIEKFHLNEIDMDRKYLLSPEHIHGLDPLHYEDIYYSDFILNFFNQVFSLNVHSISDLEKQNKTDLIKRFYKGSENRATTLVNMISRNDFDYWKGNNKDDFVLSSNEISLCVSNDNERQYRQLHSPAIEVSCNKLSNICYKLSFDILIDNVDELNEENDGIFLVRTHSSKFTLWHKDGVSSQVVYAKDINIESKIKKHVEIIIEPNARFLRLGPYLAQNGNIEWSNISLQRY